MHILSLVLVSKIVNIFPSDLCLTYKLDIILTSIYWKHSIMSIMIVWGHKICSILQYVGFGHLQAVWTILGGPSFSKFTLFLGQISNIFKSVIQNDQSCYSVITQLVPILQIYIVNKIWIILLFRHCGFFGTSLRKSP